MFSHLKALVNFLTNTLPKPVLFALLYRLTILQLASRILPTIGADTWESEEGVPNEWDDRPVSWLSIHLKFRTHVCCADIHSVSLTPHVPAIYLRDSVFASLACVLFFILS